MSVEVDSVILLCKYGSHTAVIKCCRGSRYEDLVRKLCLKFRKLRGDDMQLFYTLKDNELCLLDNNESMEVMFDLACCYGIRVFRVTVFNSLDSSCLGDEVVEIGFNQSSGSCLSTEVEVNGSASSNKGSSNSIVGGAVGFAGSSCLGDEVLEIGFNHSGGSSISCLSTEVGVTCTASSSKSNVGGAVGFGGSSGSGAGLCADGGSCSNYKGKGLAEFRSEWRLELEKERDLLPMFCEHRDRPLLSDGWRNLIKEVNQQFKGGVIEFRDCLAKYAIFFGFEYCFAKNEKDRVTAFCKVADCKWRVHARLDKVSGYFYIRSFDNVHTCGAANLSTRHSRVSSSLIGRLVSDDIRTTPLKRARDVVTDLKGLYGVDVPYKRAWSGVEKGKSEAFGDYAASYDDLRWYREAVMNSDPSSVFDIDVDGETKRFQRLFVAFGACIHGFKHLRPLLFIDGTFLKGNFKGCLLSASGKDGNRGLFPLCFGVVDSESNDNWLWFMMKLRCMLEGDSRSVVFVSDRNAGIKAAVPKAFPSSYHGFFLHHLKNNLRGRLTGSRNKYKERVVYQFSACAYAPNEMKFNEELVKLKKLGGEVRITNFLSDLPYEHWANAYFKGQRYGEMWSNMAECFNSWIEKERHLPITQLVDRIRLKMMELMCFRRETAAKWRHVICPKMDEALTNAFQESKSWDVKFCSSDVLEVLCDPSVMVDIGRRTCSCTQWQLNGVPCVHAVCAIKKSRRALNDCVDRYFHVECYREAYSRSIMPIPTLWKPEGVSGATILAPLSKKPPGRNKKKRIRSFGEKVKSIKCTRCGKRGSHNRRSCKEAL